MHNLAQTGTKKRGPRITRISRIFQTITESLLIRFYPRNPRLIP
jgi:hypothetical protein